MDTTNLPPVLETGFRTLVDLLMVPEPQLTQLQNHLEEQLRPLQEEDWPEPLASRLRALLTEIQRELRLLQMEMMYLRAGRSPQREQRLQQIEARFERLRQYCRTVLEPDQPLG